MTDKEKYKFLLQRYWVAETTPEEERELVRYAARMADSDFEDIRGVLGYLSIGKEKRQRRARTVRALSFAAMAASVVAVAVSGLGHDKTRSKKEDMAIVEASLAEFFSAKSPAEENLIEK